MRLDISKKICYNKYGSDLPKKPSVTDGYERSIKRVGAEGHKPTVWAVFVSFIAQRRLPF